MSLTRQLPLNEFNDVCPLQPILVYIRDMFVQQYNSYMYLLNCSFTSPKEVSCSKGTLILYVLGIFFCLLGTSWLPTLPYEGRY